MLELMVYSGSYQTNLFEQEPKVLAYNSPVLSTFVVKKRELIDVLNALWAYFKFKGKNKHFVRFEITVREDHVVFSNGSSERYIVCSPTGFVKATFYYQELLDALRMAKKQELTFAIQNGIVALNGVRISADVENYDPSMDITRNTPTLEEVAQKIVPVDPYAPEKNKYRFTKDGKKGFTLSQIFSDAQMVEHYLKKYGIGFFEIQDYINSFLVNKKP
jgi:hypothetical protein